MITKGSFARKLRTFRAQVAEMGMARASRIAVDSALIGALAKIYCFPPAWHNPTSARPYRLVVARAVNALQPVVVCEVGCGLGSILSRIHARQRIGYDIDPGVVRAACLVRSRSIQFREGSLADVTVPRMDVLILVNWIHDIAPDELARGVLPLLARTRYLIVDAIDQGTEGYKYHHEFAFLKGYANVREELRIPGESRTFVVYEVGR